MPMHASVDQFYAERFAEVIPLHQEKLTYEKAAALLPEIPRGWVELAHLDHDTRIEFTSKFWMKRLPFHPRATRAISQFFSHLEDIGIYLVKDKQSYFAELVYSMQEGFSFFRGGIPLPSDQIQAFNAFFHSCLPKDYLAFFTIHNGFGKATDTGILKMEEVRHYYEKIKEETKEAWAGQIRPGSLIPFYQCFGLQTYQCFFKDWHPTQEMGNIHYSSVDKTLSRYDDPESTLAFETFSDWLAFYLEPPE